jgi:hypothetical protein
MVGPVAGEENKKYEGWMKSTLIETIIEYPADFDKGCKEEIYKTLEVKYPGDVWETEWNEREPIGAGEAPRVQIEDREGSPYFVVTFTQEDFEKGQMRFGTEEAWIAADMALVYRNGDGKPITQLTQNFTLNVTNPAAEQESDCRYTTLVKDFSARYDQIGNFAPLNDVTMDSWGSFYIAFPLKLDLYQLDSACLATYKILYELYIERQTAPVEFVRF